MMNAEDFRARGLREGQAGSVPVVTITGLPGSGSEVIAREVALRTGSRFADDEITRRLCQRLQRSLGELQALEGGYRSAWSRMLRALVSPWERYPVFDLYHDAFGAWPSVDDYEAQQYLTKEEYIEGLKSAIAEIAQEGSVVLHGQASHLFVPSHISALHVFVTAPKARLAEAQPLSSKIAERLLIRDGQDCLAIFKNLFGSDLLDMERYDIVLNLERLPHSLAVETVTGALGITTRDSQGGIHAGYKPNKQDAWIARTP